MKRAERKTRNRTPEAITALYALCFLLSGFARADTITFTGSSIALRGCTIQAVQGGQVSYTDPAGQRQRRPIEQIASLSFDGLPDLDQAEAAFAQNDLEGGLRPLLRALLRSETDLQRLWVRIRLAQVHDLRGEYVQAAGHAGAAFALSSDVALKSLRPVSPVTAPSLAAAREAMENLQEAVKRVTSAELKREAQTMLRNVEAVHAELAKALPGQDIDARDTVSGFLKRELLEGRAPPPAAASQVAQAPPSPPASVPAPPAANADPRSPEAIDRLLAAGKGADAAALCGEIEQAPGSRDLAHFLYQYGRALSLSNRKRDAAVMFTRCSILFPEAPDAALSLVETAVICREEFQNEDAARRLLQKVISDAGEDDKSSAAMLARELLNRWTTP